MPPAMSRRRRMVLRTVAAVAVLRETKWYKAQKHGNSMDEKRGGDNYGRSQRIMSSEEIPI